MFTKQFIQNLLETNPLAVGRALIVLNERQTLDEQSQETTKYQNGRGFKPCHAYMGTSMARQFANRGYLTEKQVAYWRTKDKRGVSRICCYWAQLIEVAEEKAKNVKVAA